MAKRDGQLIRIAAALIDDDDGRVMLVRKAGTSIFMQAGGKIEHGEDAWTALRRELKEEIGLIISESDKNYLGSFLAPAANEPGRIVEAEIFHIRTSHEPNIAAEIEEAVWVHPKEAKKLNLAPLTRNHILPLVYECLQENYKYVE